MGSDNALVKSIQSLKIKLLYHYFNIRINQIADPYSVRFRKDPYQYLFILSHMRSGSSLFSHILNSNPQIIGYGETHINYDSVANFKDLQFKVYWQLKDISMTHRYILDKILHNHKITDSTILKTSNLSNIFLIREPLGTISSIFGIKPHWSEQKAVDYYCQRLECLVNYAKIIDNPSHCLLITYEQLLNNSDQIFQQLQQFLKTKQGFSGTYQVLRTTGMRGIGDSSENIKAGRIIKPKKSNHFSLSEKAIARTKAVFAHCKQELEQRCMQ